MHMKYELVARKYMSTAAQISKKLYDTKVAFHWYMEGDVVWCLMEVRKVEISPKLECMYEGHFLIRRKLSELDFVVQLDQMGTERPVHHNKLNLYEGDNPPKWVLKAKKKLSSHCSARQ